MVCEIYINPKSLLTGGSNPSNLQTRGTAYEGSGAMQIRTPTREPQPHYNDW